MRNGFKILDHPSDIGVEAYGSSLKEAFSETAKGLLSIIIEPVESDLLESRSISLHAGDTIQLLVKWLSEILYLFDGLQFVGTEFSIETLTETDLIATVRGMKFIPGRHPAKLDVKAVTYHNIAIEGGLDGCTIRVFLDI